MNLTSCSKRVRGVKLPNDQDIQLTSIYVILEASVRLMTRMKNSLVPKGY